jgi:diaminohydroxyphosphoribosylaminopyrimidine deaminase/5-amino-6-(5-phosphoribosylamino)uracil reductase
MANEARWMNRRFLTSVEQQRPYVVLKWARSVDGLLDKAGRRERAGTAISSAESNVLVHRWRSEEQAILVGGNTVLRDDPSLTVRHVIGRQPLRVVLDRSGVAPADSVLFMDGGMTLLFTERDRSDVQVEQIIVARGDEVLPILLRELHKRDVRSLLVEGGARLHGAFLASGLWDEARIIEAPIALGSGTEAPAAHGILQSDMPLGADHIRTYVRSAELRRPVTATLSDPWC